MKRIIWSDTFTLDEWEECLREEFEEGRFPDYESFEDIPRDELLTRMVEINGEYLEDERINLDIKTKNPIIAIARLGLWNGHPLAYKVLGRNVKNLLESPYEPTWFYDGKDVRCDEAHHDGVNHILYRELGDDEDLNEEFISKVYNQEVTEADIDKYTSSIGPYVQKVYGW